MSAETAPGGLGGRLLSATATVTANLYLLVGTIVMASLALLSIWLGGRWFHAMARIWSRGVLWSSGVRLETRFAEPLPAGGYFVFMANHQSLLDIPVLLCALPGQTRFLAKRSLFRIPVFGWALKAGGFISIDRSDRSRAGESFGDAIRELRGGASAVVFPEGTRSEDGRLLPFQRGGFLLALKVGLPIVPVGIRGSREVRAKAGYRVRPGAIEVRCGRPLTVADYGVRDKSRLMDSVRRQVAELAAVELR